MDWPWKFVNLSPTQVEERRQTLDRYAAYAHISSVAPVFMILSYRLALRAISTFDARRIAYAQVPESPARKARRESGLGAWEAKWRLCMWWRADDIVFFGQSWGRRDEWLFGLGWGVWMLLLSVSETGDDYLHLTKRLGIIGISQLPLQYLLSLKSLNPIAYMLRSSHQGINRFHRALGRVVYLLLSLHAILYLNFFVQNGLLWSKLLSSQAVQTGVIGFLGVHLLGATALKAVRTYSYRLFFITHVAVALGIPPLIWFHAHSARAFVVEAFVVFLLDVVSRNIDTVTSEAFFEAVPGTRLVKITTSIPLDKIQRFRNAPGSHVYLQIPRASRLSQNPTSRDYLVHEFLLNPFTVASVDDEKAKICLVARHRNGPMTATLQQLASTTTSGGGSSHVPLAIEGPYAAASYAPEAVVGEYDRVLLVAGGVGATFTVPLYRALRGDNPVAKVQLVWAVRTAGDAEWANAKDGKTLAEQEGVQLFVTGTTDATDARGDSVELESMSDDQDANHTYARPDLRQIVDDVFKQGQEETVAVLFCGPPQMGRDLRRYVRQWVKKGRVVFWHNESFEW